MLLMSDQRHTLYLLHLGRLGTPGAVADEAELDPVPGYLIRTASGRTILVDSGNPAALIGASTTEPWESLRNDTWPEDDVVARLADLSIAPDDVDLLISTHFDFDHCGRHDAFAAVGIESVVQRTHLEEAHRDPLYNHGLWNLPGIRYTAVEGDVELEPGLRLLLTPGHVPGHQSLYVETTAGPVVLAIDAINRAEELETGMIAEWYSDLEGARRSQERLVAQAAETGAFLICGHDPVQWPTLPKSPAPFHRP
jgi:N-acyl homoserine lactone hydrolase